LFVSSGSGNTIYCLFQLAVNKAIHLLFVSSGSEQGYSCTGNVTEWTKCLNIVQTPARRAFKVPKEFKDVAVL